MYQRPIFFPIFMLVIGCCMMGCQSDHKTPQLPPSTSLNNVLSDEETPVATVPAEEKAPVVPVAEKATVSPTETAAPVVEEKSEEDIKQEKAAAAQKERRRKRREKRRKEQERKAKAAKAAEAKKAATAQAYEFTEKGALNAAKKEEDLSDVDPELLDMVQAKAGGTPAIKFHNETYNFGRIMEGKEVDYNFVFTNTGNGPLVINDVQVTCGCTKPFYPFVPIQPGETGKISVHFNSKGRLGSQKPKITVYTNAKPKTYELFLEGVIDAERAER